MRAANIRSVRQHLASRVLYSSFQPCARFSQIVTRCFVSTSQIAIGLSLPGHCCDICFPGSGFFCPQSSGATVAAVQSLAVLGVKMAWVQNSNRVAQHSRSSFRASCGCYSSIRVESPARLSWSFTFRAGLVEAQISVPPA